MQISFIDKNAVVVPDEYPEVSRKTIWNFQQNNPELVLRDAEKYLKLPKLAIECLRTFMLTRGVNKWLKVRRDLIAYKKLIKHQVVAEGEKIVELKKKMTNTPYGSREFHLIARDKAIAKERLKLLMQVRSDLKAMCMTDRWQLWPRSVSKKTVCEMNTIKASD